MKIMAMCQNCYNVQDATDKCDKCGHDFIVTVYLCSKCEHPWYFADNAKQCCEGVKDGMGR